MRNNLKLQNNNTNSTAPLTKNFLLVQYPNNNINNQTPNFMLRKSTLSRCLTAFLFMLITLVATAQVQSSFAVNQSQQCLNGNSFVFTNTSSSGAGITYSWNFGDGTTSSVANPTKSYAAAGYFSVQLVTDSGGIHHYANNTVVVNPLPVASYYYIASTTNGFSYTFISTSTISNGVMNYFWDFGDGTTSTLINPIKAFFAAGTYTVKLRVTSDGGCKDSTSQTVTVAVGSLSSLFNTSSASTQCLAGNSFTFYNQSSTGAGVTYSWDFGSGASPATSNSATPPTVTYSTTGTKTVTLTVNAPGPITTFSTQTIYVVGNPHSSFTYSNTNNNYTFSSTSVNGANLNWNFGDGGTANDTIAHHTYSASGTYTVRLIATNANVSDTSYQTVFAFVPPAPVAAFSVTSATTQCTTGNSFTFNNTSSGAGNSYHWYFPNATPSSDTTATPGAVVFNNYGTYTVTLTVTNSNGSSTATQSVTILPKPTASFSYSVDSIYKHTFFNGSYIATGSISSYNWKLDGVSFSALQNPAQQIFSAGTHTVTLITTSALGCVDSSVQTINVGVTPPPSGAAVAAFSVTSSSSQCQIGNSFTFSNTSTGAGNSYVWSFPNATPSSSSAANPGTVVFNGYGKYTVTLLASNSIGTTTTSQTVTVGPKPTASFSYSNNTNVYNFFNGSYVAQDTIQSYNWSLDGVTFSVAKNPTPQTITGGAHSVRLIVISNIGCADTTTQNISVASKPLASFAVASLFTQCLNGNSFTFTNTTIGTGISYSWNFGDGTSSGSNSSTHTYTTAGTFVVKLFATNSGGTDSTSQTVFVTASPVANFGFSVAGNVVTFLDSSTGASTYSYDFGDGFTSPLANLSRAYASLGTYTVKLITTSSLGCKDSISKTVAVGNLPTAAFTVTSASTQCSNNNIFTFSNTSTSGAGVSYRWSFGDGTIDSIANPTKTYTGAGTFVITLAVTNALGTTSTTQSVILLAGPKVDFATYSNSNSGSSYTFVSTSSVPAGNMIYAWDLGNGTTSTLVNPTVTYATPGTYTVKLVVNGGTACADSISKTVTFCPTVTAKFGVTSATSQCVSGNSFTFADSTTTNATSAYSIAYSWSFGDSTFSTLQNPPAHTYAAWGDYDVKLKVTLTNGSCTAKDSITKLKVVSAQPMPVASYRLILDNFYVPTALASDTTKRCWHHGYDFSYQSSSTLGRGVMDYFWHFGTSALYFRDGDSSHYINPRIVFDTAGTYPVKLVVVSDKGCKDSVTRIVELSDPRSRFNYTIDSVTNIYASPVVSVTNASYDYGGYLVAWNWNFGGGVANSSLQNPASFSYACGGSHSIDLQVTSDVGCVVDTVRTLVIRIRPHAIFSISAPNFGGNVYARPTYTYTNGTTVNDACPAMSYAWNFGDGYTSAATNPTHIYKGSGTYTTTLIATNGNGGKKDTTTQTVTVLIKPKAAFSTSQTLTPNAYAAPTVTYTNGSTVTDSATTVAGLGYAWDFGDGATASVANPPTHQYASGGTYAVTLIVTNPISGLKDTVSHNVTVKVKPQAAFSSNVDYGGDIYSNPVVSFTDATTANDAAAAFTYSWNFGDATGSTLQNPTHIYAAGGTYNVMLTVTNTNGALVDVVSHNVVITITPKAILSVHIDTISVPVPMSIGNADYKHYTLTATNNLANPSTVVTGSIAHTEIKIDTVYIPTAATNLYADVFDADAEFAVQLDTVPNYLFNVTLTVTSDLGVTDVTTATLGASEAGFTPYRISNPASTKPVIKLPSIGTSQKVQQPIAISKVQGLQVYPNPGTDNINVSVNVAKKVSAVTLRLYNSSGKLVQQQKQDIAISSDVSRQNLNLNVTNLSVGTYNIVMVDDKGNVIGNAKFVKAK